MATTSHGFKTKSVLIDDNSVVYENFNTIFGEDSSSNTNILERILTTYDNKFADLDKRTDITTVKAIKVTDNYYEANVTGLAEYGLGMFIVLYLNTTNVGQLKININSIREVYIKKVVGGVLTDLEADDLKSNTGYMLQFDGARFVLIDESYVQQIKKLQSEKQNKTDDLLATTDKTIVGAINELDTNKQDKELRTGSETEYKVLSDNNYTDAEKNTISLLQIPLLKNTVLYVSPIGNDTIGDGTQTKPFATITKAINAIPKCLNGFNATVNIADGTYSEVVSIIGFYGKGVVAIVGNTSNPINCKVNNIVTDSVYCTQVILDGLCPTVKNGINCLTSFNQTIGIVVKNCLFDGIDKSTGGIMALGGVTANIINCTFNNCNNAISIYGTIISINHTPNLIATKGLSGTNNNVAISATNSIVFKVDASMPTATTAEYLASSLMINPSGGKVGT